MIPYPQITKKRTNLVKHEDSALRREQILNAATTCIAGVGLDRTTMDGIARAAGLSKGSLYWHFKNKSAILEALVERIADELLLAWTDQSAPLKGNVATAGAAALKNFALNRELLETWLELLHHPDARLRMSTMYRDLRVELARGFGRGGQKTSAAVVALFEGLLVQVAIDSEFDPIPVWRTYSLKLVES